MLKKIKVIFFGSFLHYSAKVLESLLKTDTLTVAAVVTTPPLVDKKGEHKNPVQLLAEAHQVPVFTPEKLTTDLLTGNRSQVTGNNKSEPLPVAHDLLPEVDLFITAGYGKLLPVAWLEAPKIASLNLHLSLLPAYRGANPGEWALLMGEKKAGVTLIEMSPKFDTGRMVAQSSLAVSPEENRETLYEKLYDLGAEILPASLEAYINFRLENETKLHKDNKDATELQNNPLSTTPSSHHSNIQIYLPPQQQPPGKHVYARRLTRDDGFIDWKIVQLLMKGIDVPKNEWPLLLKEIIRQSQGIPSGQVTGNSDAQLIHTAYSLQLFVERATRALYGFPSLWTEVPTSKGLVRMKILAVSNNQEKLQLEKVHLASKAPAKWNEVKNGIMATD